MHNHPSSHPQQPSERQEAVARENRRLLGKMLHVMERDPVGAEAISGACTCISLHLFLARSFMMKGLNMYVYVCLLYFLPLTRAHLVLPTTITNAHTPPTAPPATLHLLTRPRNERVQRQQIDRINRENKVRADAARAMKDGAPLTFFWHVSNKCFFLPTARMSRSIDTIHTHIYTHTYIAGPPRAAADHAGLHRRGQDGPYAHTCSPLTRVDPTLLMPDAFPSIHGPKKEEEYLEWLARRRNLSRFHLRQLRAAALDAADEEVNGWMGCVDAVSWAVGGRLVGLLVIAFS